MLRFRRHAAYARATLRSSNATTMQYSLHVRQLMELCMAGELVGTQGARVIRVVDCVASHDELKAKTNWLNPPVIDSASSSLRFCKGALHAVRNTKSARLSRLS